MKKRITSLLIVCAMLLSAVAGLAQDATSDSLLAVGDKIHGFTVTDEYALDSLDATCFYMIHDKTKARLTYVACEDNNRAFDITFRTPGDDDKGIPHVFEHATLCGSEKYPDPSLFFNMMFQTYNTYLNAMTMQSCTTFPAASLSEDQLYVYADYILSGVFNPLIMTDERAMMREAYRYELADEQSDITLAGTVYSEMQGNLMLTGRASYNLKKLLYPGSITSNIVGGDPAVIPTMTHQELKDFHDNYYHPSNSMIVLYGKLDYDKFLKLIDEEYLSKYDYRDIKLNDSAYAPFEGFREQVYYFPVAEDAQQQPVAIYGISMPEATAEDMALFSIIANALYNESSSFMKLFREKLPLATAGVVLDDTSADPTFMVMGINVGEEDKDTFKNVADEAIAQVLEDGLDMNAIESLCRQQHFTDVLSKGQSGTGVNAAFSIGMTWGQSEDPFGYKVKSDVTNDLMSYVNADAFNVAFRKNLSTPVRSALALTLPDDGGLERQSKDLARSLADKKAAMTDEEISALIARTADFNEWTQKNTENSMIEDVKVVSVQNLPEEVNRYEAEDKDVNGMRTVTSQAELSDVISIALKFDASVIPFDQLLDYSIFATLLTSMATEKYTSQELSDALAGYTYSPSVYCETIKYKSGGYHPVLNVSWTTTQDMLDASFDLFEEILLSVDFTDCDLIRRVLRENVLSDKIMASVMPDMLLSSYGSPLVNDDSLYSNYLSGDENMLYRNRISEMTDEEIASVAQSMLKIRDMLLNKNGFILTCVGTKESIEQTVARAEEFYGKLDETKLEKADYTGLLPRYDEPLASVIDGTVQFNMQIMSMKDAGFEDSGKMIAMGQLVYDKILMQVLRFQNSAYGARSSLDGDIVSVGSYRDPNLSETFDVFATLGDRIRALSVTQDDLDGYITGAYSNFATPIGAMAGGSQAVSDALTGETTFDDYLRYMKEIKQFTPEDVVAYSAIYDMLAEKGAKVTVGGAEAIEQNRAMFKTILTNYVD